MGWWPPTALGFARAPNGRGAGGIEGSTEIARVNLLDLGLARARGWGADADDGTGRAVRARGGARQHSRFNNCGEGAALTMLAVVTRARIIGKQGDC